MNNKIVVCCVMFLICLGLSSGLYTSIDGSEESEIDNIDNIVVLSDALNLSDTSNHEIKSINNIIESIPSDTSVLIDSIDSNSNDTLSVFENLVDRGNPVIFDSGVSDIVIEDFYNVSTAFVENADLYGILYDSDTGTTFCYSSIGSDKSVLVSAANEWLQTCKTMSNSEDDEPDPVVYSLIRIQESFGTMTIDTKYTKYAVDNNTNLILTEYSLTADPETEDSIWDNWISIADMKISCSHENSTLLSYGPVLSSSSEFYDVDLHASYLGVVVDKNWSYSVKESETTVSSSGNSYSIYHDVDEKGSDKLSTKIMKPGTISLAQKGSSIFYYQETENYVVTYYKDRTIAEDKYVTDDCSLTVTLL